MAVRTKRLVPAPRQGLVPRPGLAGMVDGRSGRRVGNGEALAREIPGARLLVLERAATAIPDAAAGEVAAAMLEL